MALRAGAALQKHHSCCLPTAWEAPSPLTLVPGGGDGVGELQTLIWGVKTDPDGRDEHPAASTAPCFPGVWWLNVDTEEEKQTLRNDPWVGSADSASSCNHKAKGSEKGQDLGQKKPLWRKA